MMSESDTWAYLEGLSKLLTEAIHEKDEDGMAVIMGKMVATEEIRTGG